MAVFTELSDDDYQAIAKAYGMTSLSSVVGIADGDTETTYLFCTKEGEFIVTLFENGAEPLDLERAFETMDTLHRSNVPCPKPLRTTDGHATLRAAGRLVATVGFLPGSSSMNANTAKCDSLGRNMAKIHSVLIRKSRRISSDLPTGSVHGALIPENVFYLGDNVSGIINFRLRHDDILISEVAEVLVNWTSDATGKLDKDRASAILRGYNDVRELTQDETKALPGFVMASASRLHASKKDRSLLPEIAVIAYESITPDLLS